MFYLSPRTYFEFAKRVFRTGNEIVVDGNMTREIINAEFAIKNPLDRIVTQAQRQINLPFAVAEWLGMMTGEDRVEFYTTFIRDFGRYSTDGKVIAGAYGPRMTRQIDPLIRELERDPMSRRAVITIFDGNQDLSGEIIIPCTLNFQFMIRRGVLNMITTMRSNDVYFGLPYDIFQFTMLQEYIANKLNVPLGTYYHRVGSLHLYERQYPNVILATREIRWPHVMSKMPTLKDNKHYSLYDEISMLRSIYYDVANFREFDKIVSSLHTQYFKDFAWAAKAFVERFDHEKFYDAYKNIQDMTVKKIMRLWR